MVPIASYGADNQLSGLYSELESSASSPSEPELSESSRSLDGGGDEAGRRRLVIGHGYLLVAVR